MAGWKDFSAETKRNITHICLIWAFLVMSWSTVLSSTPLILKDIVGVSEAADWMGTLTATTAIVGMVMCSCIGYISDRLGRMVLIIPSILIFFISSVLVLYADVERAVMPMWIARIAALSVPSTLLHAFVADLVSGSNVVEVHGYMGATFGVAAMIGAGICGVVTRQVSRPSALLFGSCCGLISTILAMCAPRSLSGISRPTSHESLIVAAKHINKNDPLLRGLILSFSLLKVGNINSSFMFTLYANFRYGWDVLDCAVLVGMVGAVGVVLQFFGIPFVLKRYDNITPYLFISVAAMPIAMIGYGFSTTTTGLWLWAFVGSLISVSIALFTSKIAILGAEDGLAGTAIGLVGTLQNVIESVMAILFGQLLKWSLANYGPRDVMAGLPYFLNSIPYFMSLFVLWHCHSRHGRNRLAWIGNAENPKSPTAIV